MTDGRAEGPGGGMERRDDGRAGEADGENAAGVVGGDPLRKHPSGGSGSAGGRAERRLSGGPRPHRGANGFTDYAYYLKSIGAISASEWRQTFHSCSPG
jgi:hypothetical protein